MAYASTLSTSTAAIPHPTRRPAPFFRAGGEGRCAGEADTVEDALRLVESHRRLSCAHYDACLEVAAAAGWHGWSCQACALGAAPRRAELAWSRSADAATP